MSNAKKSSSGWVILIVLVMLALVFLIVKNIALGLFGEPINATVTDVSSGKEYREGKNVVDYYTRRISYSFTVSGGEYSGSFTEKSKQPFLYAYDKKTVRVLYLPFMPALNAPEDKAGFDKIGWWGVALEGLGIVVCIVLMIVIVRISHRQRLEEKQKRLSEPPPPDPATLTPQQRQYGIGFNEPAQQGSQQVRRAAPEQPPQPVFCSLCGTQLKPGAKFCRSCGAPVDE